MSALTEDYRSPLDSVFLLPRLIHALWI